MNHTIICSELPALISAPPLFFTREAPPPFYTLPSLHINNSSNLPSWNQKYEHFYFSRFISLPSRSGLVFAQVKDITTDQSQIMCCFLLSPYDESRDQTINKKLLLDEVFVISRIIEVEVGVIRLRLITLTETSIILDITKTESNNCFIIHWTERLKSCFCSFTDGPASSTKHANLTWLPLEIMHRGHTWHDYPWPPVSLTWLLYNLQLWRHGLWFRKFTVRFQPIRKEIVSSMYNNNYYYWLRRRSGWKSVCLTQTMTGKLWQTGQETNVVEMSSVVNPDFTEFCI